MDAITEYKIVMATTPVELVNEVNELIKVGWIPTGGIVITQSPASQQIGDYVGVQTFSHQSMVKLKVF